ncbi:MAG: HAD family hydrolase [Lachnospiraceae bacterium]|nr:HAD family hydrolase [Lachnospiraceae bacterium]
MKQYKNYIFDLYSTLIEVKTNEKGAALWKYMAAIYAGFGAEYDWRDLRRSFWEMEAKARSDAQDEMGEGYAEIEVGDLFLRLLKEAPKKHEIMHKIADERTWVITVTEVFRSLSRKQMEVYPWTVPVLTELKKRGCGVYLLSNAQSLFTRSEIEMTGLDGLFDDIYISSEFGRLKPDPVFLLSLMKRYRMKPEETVMVGNDLFSDMCLAQAGGIDGVLLNTSTFSYTKEEIQERNTMNAVVIEDMRELLK